MCSAVLQPLCILVDDEGDMAAFKDYEPPALKTSASPPAQPVADTRPPVAAPPPPVSAAPPPPPLSSAPPPSSGVAGRIFASPYAKSVAAAQGVDLAVRPPFLDSDFLLRVDPLPYVYQIVEYI